MTFAIFQASGNLEDRSDKLNSILKGCAIKGNDSLNSLWLMRSGPHALFNDRLLMISITSWSVINISLRDDLQGGTSTGKDNLVSSKTVNEARSRNRSGDRERDC